MPNYEASINLLKNVKNPILVTLSVNSHDFINEKV